MIMCGEQFLILDLALYANYFSLIKKKVSGQLLKRCTLPLELLLVPT
jgi:hypothetical protein